MPITQDDRRIVRLEQERDHAVSMRERHAHASQARSFWTGVLYGLNIGLATLGVSLVERDAGDAKARREALRKARTDA